MLGSELWDNKCGSMLDRALYILYRCVGVMAIILAFNSHSLRLRLENCRVSLVEALWRSS